MNADLITQIVRYVLLGIGGYFIHKGSITQGTLDNIIGYTVEIVTFGWGLYVKFGTRAVPADTAARSDVPTVSSVTGAVQH